MCLTVNAWDLRALIFVISTFYSHGWKLHIYVTSESLKPNLVQEDPYNLNWQSAWKTWIQRYWKRIQWALNLPLCCYTPGRTGWRTFSMRVRTFCRCFKSWSFKPISATTLSRAELIEWHWGFPGGGMFNSIVSFCSSCKEETYFNYKCQAQMFEYANI